MYNRCLLKHRVLHYSPSKASKIIKSCIMLHNLCINDNVPLVVNEPLEVEDVDFGIIPPMVIINENRPNHENRNNELLVGRRIRQDIVATFYTL